MKKLEKKQIFGIAAIALGVVAVVKIVGDIRKIKKLTAEKEEAIGDDAAACEEAPATEEVADADAEPAAE